MPMTMLSRSADLDRAEPFENGSMLNPVGMINGLILSSHLG
jgi:hypothetical protein